MNCFFLEQQIYKVHAHVVILILYTNVFHKVVKLAEVKHLHYCHYTIFNLVYAKTISKLSFSILFVCFFTQHSDFLGLRVV